MVNWSSIPEVIDRSIQDIMNTLVYKYVTSNGSRRFICMYKQEKVLELFLLIKHMKTPVK